MCCPPRSALAVVSISNWWTMSRNPTSLLTTEKKVTNIMKEYDSFLLVRIMFNLCLI